MIDNSSRNFYEFDSFRVDVRRRLLLQEGKTVRVTPKAFEVLLGLVRSGGRVLSKNEMLSTIWPDCFVEESNLAQNIFLLRRIFGEGKNEHKFIITIPGVGYRFAPHVRELGAIPVSRKVSAGNDQRIDSIAVLPLKPLSKNETVSCLGIAIADALITRLSNLKLVKVMPTSTVMELIESLRASRPGESALDVDALLDGLYQQDGKQLRVSVQLIRVGDGTILWAEKFDEEFTTLFAVQDSISEQVAKALVARLCSQEQPRLSVVRDTRKVSFRRCS